MRENKKIAEEIANISYKEIKSLANSEAKSKFLGDQLRLTFIDGFQSGFDKGAEEMAILKDEQIEKLVAALEFIVDREPKDGDKLKACTFCDMGGAGYSSKGDGHHDDVKHICPVFKAQKALENFRKEGK